MKTTLRRLSMLSVMMLIACCTFAQTNNLVVFSQDGYKFTLIVNGLRQNEKPETNVKVTGLTAPNYKVRVIFDDANLATIDQNVYFSDGAEDAHGKEFTYAITQTKKGMKLKSNSIADITTTQAAPDQVVYQFNPSGNATQTGGYSSTTTTTTTGDNASTNVTATGDDNSGNVSTNTSVSDGNGGTVSTTTTTTTTTTGDGGTVGMNMGGMGVGINININDNTGGMSSSSTTTTTTTSSSSSSTTMSSGTTGSSNTTTTAPAPASTVCSYPMSSSDFEAAKKSVSNQSFEEEKLKIAKQILNTNCMSTSQVKDIMSLFSFEDTKLDWAKFAYGKTTDPQNYYQLNDGFTYSSSVDALNDYIESHK